jgi:hypothetical protein
MSAEPMHGVIVGKLAAAANRNLGRAGKRKYGDEAIDSRRSENVCHFDGNTYFSGPALPKHSVESSVHLVPRRGTARASEVGENLTK